jgi:hypothetical protein
VHTALPLSPPSSAVATREHPVTVHTALPLSPPLSSAVAVTVQPGITCTDNPDVNNTV